jgi:hypothetical protein
MKSTWLSMFMFLVSPLLFSQVAINNDGSPVSDSAAMLEIKKGSMSKLKVRSLHYDDTARLELSNRTPDRLGTDFLISANREMGLYISSRSDISSFTNDSLLTIRTNGRVGIGNRSPAAKLDVNGDINFAGYLRVNGVAGSNGQVLTSTGTGAPQWKTGAYTDNIRFGARFYGPSNPLNVSATYYNLSPANITIGSDFISFAQSGLYHFEGVYFGLAQGASFTREPEFSMYFNLTGSSNYGYSLCTWQPMTLRRAVNSNWFFQDHFSIDIYITAPAQLEFSRLFLATPSPTYNEASATIYGYRISE